MNAVRWLDRKIAGFFGGTRNIKLAQGLEIVLVVLHKRLTGHFSKKYPETDKKFAENLATAVLNELFPRTKPGRATATFARKNRRLIKDSLEALGSEVPELCREITLALYVRGILDEPLGGETPVLFERATRLGIFSPEVTIPQPKEFFQHALELARSSGIGSAD